MQPAMVMHPIRPELNGKDLRENKDPDGKHLLVEFVSVVKADGAGYVDYLWPKPGAKEPEPARRSRSSSCPAERYSGPEASAQPAGPGALPGPARLRQTLRMFANSAGR